MGLIDVDVVKALGHYVKYGLDPGSFGRAILAQDEEMAYRTAHPLLKAEEDVVANMLRFVRDRVPQPAHGSHEAVQNWISHNGFEEAPIECSMIVVEMKLKNVHNWWDD